MFSGKTPFHGHPLASVILLVMQGNRPSRPSKFGNEGRPVDDDLWALLEDCWKQAPNDRPEVGMIVQRIQSWPPKGNWDEVFMREIRSDIKENPFYFAPEPSDAAVEIPWLPDQDLNYSPGPYSQSREPIPEILLSPAIDNGSNFKEPVSKASRRLGNEIIVLIGITQRLSYLI